MTEKQQEEILQEVEGGYLNKEERDRIQSEEEEEAIRAKNIEIITGEMQKKF